MRILAAVILCFSLVSVSEAFTVQSKCTNVFGIKRPSNWTTYLWWQTAWEPTHIKAKGTYSNAGTGQYVTGNFTVPVDMGTGGTTIQYVISPDPGLWTITGDSWIIQDPTTRDTDFKVCTV